MERDKRIATHDGKVTKVSPGTVEVQIQSVSACASCQAHAHCGFAESKNKTLEIPSAQWSQYHQGDAVKVNIDESRGMLAVWIAYVLPALLLLADITTLSLLHLPEWLVVLSAFAVLGIYIAFLYSYRKRIEGKFTLTVEPAVDNTAC